MNENQILEPDKQLSVGKVADFCQVNRVTVQRWIHAGKLKAHSLPGGHYRIRVDDLRQFFLDNDMPVPPELREGRGGPHRILIVDDSRMDRQMMRSSVESAGWDIEIRESSDGMDALIVIGDWKPDLVMLDIVMPNMDGFQFVAKIAENPLTRDIKVLVVSGYSLPEIREKLRNRHVVGFIAKPVDMATIKSTVRELLVL